MWYLAVIEGLKVWLAWGYLELVYGGGDNPHDKAHQYVCNEPYDC